MVADDLLVLADPSAGCAFEPLGKPLVQVGPRRFRERVERGVANQDVPEPVRLVAGEARAIRPDQVAADERGEIAVKRGLRQLGRQLAERAVVEERALDGPPHEQRALALRQALEPRREERVDLLRDAQVAEVAGDDPAFVLPHEALLVDEHREQLLGEQRVALGERRRSASAPVGQRTRRRAGS